MPPRPRPPTRTRHLAVTAAGTAALVALTVAAPASATAVRTPAKATHLSLTEATGSSLTVSSARATYARSYRLFVSTVKSDLYYTSIVHDRHSPARQFATSSSPQVTVRGLRYTTAPFYYRIQTFNGPKFSVSADILTAGLRPSRPTGLAAHTGRGLSLTWRSGSSTGFYIVRATNAAMTSGRVRYTISGNTRQFTPVGLAAGRRYWFAVAAVTNRTRSHFSPHAAGAPRGRVQKITAMTYNVLQVAADGSHEPGGTVTRWSRRGPAAAALIKKSMPDVVAVQEAGMWIGSRPGTRQIDTLRRYLNGSYAIARTEVTWAERRKHPGYARHHVYILYRSSRWAPVGAGGTWMIDNGARRYSNNRFAAYQLLQNRTTHARVLFVSTHLIVGYGAKLDRRRRSETVAMVHYAKAKAARVGHPQVIYGGDFNSNQNKHYHPLDGPATVMAASGVQDARMVAQRHYHSVNSMNFLMRKPMPYPVDVIDDIYVPAGAGVRSWAVGLNLKRGRIVGTIPSDHNPVVASVYFAY